MKSAIGIVNNRGFNRLALVMALFTAIVAVSYPASGACPNISDIPLNSMAQKAPGMIMFVLDDSGSMDWSIMCPPDRESGGVFNGTYYMFSNPGDDLYGYTNLEDDSSKKNMWMSQWAQYNGMYYDPETEYTPWPNMADADMDYPRSNPVISGYTLDMTTVWDTLTDSGVVDNLDAGFSSTGTWWTYNFSSYRYGSNFLLNGGTDGTYSASWKADYLDPSTNYNLYVKLAWDGSIDRT